MQYTQIKFICLIFISLFISCGQPATQETAAALAITEVPTPSANYSPSSDGTEEHDETTDGLTETTSETTVDAASDEHIEEDPSPVKAVVTEKKIIKNGTMSIKGEDIEASKKRIDAILKKLNGYYENERLSNETQRIEYILKLRVPSIHFDALLEGIEQGKDEIVEKQISAEDVTEEFVDLAARLQNKREYLERYKGILRSAKNVKEMMQVEENIRNLQEEIESKEGRLRFLKDQVGYSTLHITLFHPKEFVYREEEENSFVERFKAAFSGGWGGMLDFSLGLVHIWPILLLLFSVLWVLKRYMHKRKMALANIPEVKATEEKSNEEEPA